MSSKAPKNTTQTSVTQPPAYIQPYLEDSAKEAKSIYESDGPNYYPGKQTVGFSPDSQDAISMQSNRARYGSDLTRASQNQLTDTLRGNYLYGNPGFNSAVQATTDYTLPQVQSKFAGSGRTNSGLAQEAIARTISNAYSGQYGQERENMMKANAFAPNAAQQDYQDIAALRSAGQEVEDKGQDWLSEDVSRYNYNENLPEQKLGNYINALSGSYSGSQSSSSQPLYRNRAAGAVGGATSGAGLGSAIASGASSGTSAGPWGTLIGAIAGGLLGGQ